MKIEINRKNNLASQKITLYLLRQIISAARRG